MDYLSNAINKFNTRKKAITSGTKYTAPYGKWDDSWNIHDVLYDALKLYTINKLFNTRKYEKTRSYY